MTKFLVCAGAAVVALGLALVGTLVLFLMGSAAEAEGGTCPSGVAVPSSVDLGSSTIDGINGLKSMYEQVAAEKDVPWAALAALDYRENNNALDRSMLSGEPIGQANPDNPNVVTSSKIDSIEKAADHLRAMASSVYGVGLTSGTGGEDLKLAFLAFNRGSIYKAAGAGADLSPYVMNNYSGEAAYTDMAWPNIAGEPLAGRTETGRYGAQTVFTRLGGSSAGGCGGLSNIDVVRVAQIEIGVSEDNPGTDCDCGAALKYQGDTGPEDWCADFVSWVYMTAGHPFDGGFDGNPTIGRGWRLPGVNQLRTWMIERGTYEEHVTHSYADALPGDVVIFGAGEGDHTGIVEVVEGADTPDTADDVLRTIEGNQADSVVRRQYRAGDAYVAGWGTGPRAVAEAT